MADELKEKFRKAIPHLRFGVEEAKKETENGEALFGILVVNDNKGRVVFTFKAEEFVEDLARLVDAPPMTDEDRQNAKVAQFLSRFGIKSG